MNKLVAINFQTDIVKLSIYYFSRLPIIENKSKGNKVCARFYGIILILASAATIYAQLTIMKDVVTHIVNGDQVHIKMQNRGNYS